MRIFTRMNERIKEMPLKKAYYFMFTVLIIVPVQVVLLTALFSLNRQIRQGAIENIRQSQQAVIADVMSDMDIMSARMSAIVESSYIGSRRLLEEKINTESERGDDIWHLEQDGHIISLSLYLKNGEIFGFKNEVDMPVGGIEKTRELPWYKKALQNEGGLFPGSLVTRKDNDLVQGSQKDRLIFLLAMSPPAKPYRSDDTEMAVLYQYSKVDKRMRENNQAYLAGDNKLGMAQISDGEGNCIYATPGYYNSGASSRYVCVKTPFDVFGTTWYVENYIEKISMMEDYWKVVILALCVAAVILILMIYFSKFLLRGILNPVEAVKQGLYELEEGNLDVFIEPAGQYEMRSVIHQFNGMVEQLRILIHEYEQKDRQTPTEDYFGKLVKGELAPEDVCRSYAGFFEEPYTIIGMYLQSHSIQGEKADTGAEMLKSFSLNPRYASRCHTYLYSPEIIFVFYRITEINYQPKINRMVREIQKTAENEFQIPLFICVGKKATGYVGFTKCFNEVHNGLGLRCLTDYAAIVNLETEGEKAEVIIHGAVRHKVLADALYIADEKNVNKKRDELLDSFGGRTLEEAKTEVLSVILAIGERFEKENGSFSDVFGQKYNYMKKIEKIQDSRSMRMWLTNYLTWIIQYAEKKLDLTEADAIVKAKRYIQNNYEDTELTLARVAEHVDLSEKYFTNKFTKESGETFSEYLASIRIQKAKRLLKTTNLKVYEIAEMVGYNNVEHFNRVFKKGVQLSPTQYRKADGI